MEIVKSSHLTQSIAMIRILSKDMIVRFIVPFLKGSNYGPDCKAQLADVVSAIFYKFKTGCQWRMLPLQAFGSAAKLAWNTVYHHFRKWTLNGSWQRARRNLIRTNHAMLDLSLAHFDGTHSLAYRGGQAVGYQRRRRHKTTNTLWLVDRQGLVVSYLPPLAGQHNDLFDLEQRLDQLFEELKQLDIAAEGTFINADAAFDYPSLRDRCELHGAFLNTPIVKRGYKDMCSYDYCCDELAYQERFTVERTNAWMDAYRTLRHRDDTSLSSWIAWHDIYCIVTWSRLIESRL